MRPNQHPPRRHAARTSTLPFESQERFASIRQAAVDQLNPRNTPEPNPVSQYVVWTWRADRFLTGARVLKQLKDLRAFSVSREESQGYAAIKDKILETGFEKTQ